MLMFWIFKLSFEEDILAFFGLATVLATFSSNWVIFLSNFWSLWLLALPTNIRHGWKGLPKTDTLPYLEYLLTMPSFITL
jgi:hypothetical protein